MLKGPGLKSSGLSISFFLDKPDSGALNVFKNMFEKSYKIRKKVKEASYRELEDHNHYSGAKRIPMFSQRSFHLIVLIGALFVIR